MFTFNCEGIILEPNPSSTSPPSCSLSGSDLVDQELLVLLGPQEATEGVFFHQGEDPLLGQVEAFGSKMHQIPQGHILGEMVDVDLRRQRKADAIRDKRRHFFGQICPLTRQVLANVSKEGDANDRYCTRSEERSGVVGRQNNNTRVSPKTVFS